MFRNVSVVPKFVFTFSGYNRLLKRLVDSSSLILYPPILKRFIPKHVSSVMVKNNDAKQIKTIKRKFSFSNIIAIGGCTVHDIARMVAGKKKYTIIPTILSTSCIGTNHAVVSFGGRNHIIKVESPSKVIISLKEIMSKPKKTLMRWNASGIGDILSGIGAAIDRLYAENKPLSYNNIRAVVPTYFELLQWLTEDFKKWDKASVKKLATYSFKSSILSIERGNTDLSTGGEHDFFDEIVYYYPQLKKASGSSHGELVFLGLLIETKLLGLYTGDTRIYDELIIAADRVKLPIKLKKLESIGLNIKMIEKALHTVITNFPHTFMSSQLKNKNLKTFLTDIFGENT